MSNWMIIVIFLVGIFAACCAWRHRVRIRWYYSMPCLLLLGSGLYFSVFSLVNLLLASLSKTQEDSGWFTMFSGYGAVLALCCMVPALVWIMVVRKKIIRKYLLTVSIVFMGLVFIVLMGTKTHPSLNWW